MSEILKPVIHSASVDTCPSDVGFDESAIARLDSHFQELVINNKLQCASYLLARHGKVFAHRSLGRLTHHEDSPDLQPDSIRRIASITKLFAATAVMQLVEAGKIYMEQPVCDFLEEFNTEMHKKITILHLLTHTSGLAPDPGYFCEPYATGWWVRMEAQKAPDFPEEEKINWIKAVLSGPVFCKPGEKWNYSSAGFMLLGEIVTRVSGIPCETYILDNVIKPLALKETFFDVPDELHGRVCYTEDWGEKSLREKEDRTGFPPRTGGGIYSTLYDLYRFGQMALNKGTLDGVKILSRKTIEYMTRNHLGKNVPGFSWGSDYPEHRHGAGFNLNITELMSPGTFNHEGAGRSMLYMDPEEDLVIAAFVPTNIEWVPQSLINARTIIYSGLI